MCTPADDNILLAGTTVGSINLYDLQDFGTNPYMQEDLDYENLLKTVNPNSTNDGESNFQEKLKVIKYRY